MCIYSSLFVFVHVGSEAKDAGGDFGFWLGLCMSPEESLVLGLGFRVQGSSRDRGVADLRS